MRLQPPEYPRSWGSRTCCRPSGAGSLRRRDRPRDAVVAGAVRHPALERQQRSRTWAGHLEPGSSQPPRRGGAPATTAPRSSARRVQTASSRSRSPAAPDRRPRPAPNEPRRARCARRRGLGSQPPGWPYEADAALRGSAGGTLWRSCEVKGSEKVARQASETASGAWTLLAGSERAGFNGSRRLTARDLFHVWRPVASSGFLPLVVGFP